METQLNAEAQVHFENLEKTLKEAGRYSPGDTKPLARLAHLYAVCDRLEKEMNDAWSEKFVKQNLSTYDKLLKNILSLETAFLLNPGARVRGKVSHIQENVTSHKEEHEDFHSWWSTTQENSDPDIHYLPDYLKYVKINGVQPKNLLDIL
jgi:hypothetical protein